MAGASGPWNSHALFGMPLAFPVDFPLLGVTKGALNGGHWALREESGGPKSEPLG